MEKMPDNYIWLAWALSNLAALLTLLAAWKKPNLARLLYFLLFAWASWANARIAILHPEAYLEYANFAFLPMYKKFILGWFSENGQVMVLFIAAGQALLALSMLAKGRLFRLGCLGGILFFIGIAPLGVGSGFPSSLIWAGGLYLLFNKEISQTLFASFFGKNKQQELPTHPMT